MKNLLIQLNRIADANKKRIAVILEGRDTAGKSSTIRAITEYLNPAWYSIVPSTKPSENVMRSWLKFWATKMPAKNQIVFYDRSWYSRAMVQKMNGWCTDKQYENFLNNHLEWEAGQIAGGVHFIKFWLSISESEQRTRIEARKNSPLTYWKFSENDENALSHYDRMSILKERVVSPDWNTIDYNDKKIGIENFLKTLLEKSL